MGNWLAGGSSEELSGGSSEELSGGLSYLTSVPAHKLEEFIQANLTPNEECLKLIDQDVDDISNFLLSSEITVVRVAKGGSYGRGTVLRGCSDGTLVLFVNCFHKFGDQKAYQHLPIPWIEQLLKHHEKYNKPKKLGNILEIQLSVQGQSILLQLLPAFDPLCFGENPSSQVYRNLKSSMDQVRAAPGEFSVCFTTLQEQFFKRYPRRVKDLILLVKHWYQECRKRMTSPSLQLLYALELLTVYAWEQGCQTEDFNIAEGVRTVLGLIKQSSKLCVYWTVNYNFENETVRNTLLCQLRTQRPVILDPTDPTNNVGEDDDRNWQMLTEAAQDWLCSLGQNDMPPAPCWNVLPTPLFITPSHLLDTFIEDFLQPDETFLNQIKKAVDIICTFLKENCFRHSSTKVLKTVKGGSTAKGTALKYGSDADIVVFLSSLESYESQKQERPQFVQEIRRQLEAFQQTQKLEVKFEVSKWKAPRVLSFTLKSRNLNESVDFDVLPAYDALGQLYSGFTSRPKAYKELIELYRSSDISGGEFSTCFTELQRNFIEPRPTKLKSLIRLVKHWYKQYERKMKSKASLPPKYALELLVMYAWEHGSGLEDFDTAEGFRTVLDLVIKYPQLCIFWMVNYNFNEEPMRTFLLTQIRKKRPVILDPADPTGDVGGGDHWCWHRLAEEAEKWLSSPCFDSKPGQSIQPWKVPPTPLFITPSHLLDTFIEDFLQPDETFLNQIKKAVDIICTFLKENCFRHSSTKVLKTVKGGSTAKGTALKYGSDADIVVFLSSLESYESQKQERPQFVQEIRRQLEAFQQTQKLEVKFEVSKWKAPRVLSFTLKSRNLNESVDFDVLPAYDALGQLYSGFTSRPKAYKELIELYRSSDISGGEFSTCFTELQRNFIEPRPTKLKSLIRLVKHWYKQCERKMRYLHTTHWCESQMKSKASLPPKYALELLVVYAWEHGSGLEDFDTAEGFRTVLDLVIKYPQLCIFWMVNYNFNEEPMRTFLLTQIRKKRPVILDPADPTGDVGGGDHWCWHLLAEEAEKWLSSPCFDSKPGQSIQPWKVPVRVP